MSAARTSHRQAALFTTFTHPMILGLIYSKTEAGRMEIADRSGSLNAVQRRLLVLIDGNKPVNDLALYVRVGELEPAIEHLEQQGFIQSDQAPVDLLLPIAPGFTARTSESEVARPATSLEQFLLVRADASNFVQQKLGSAGTPITDAIDRCKSPEALRRLLRGIEVFVGERLDVQTAQSFAKHFGKLLV